MNKKGAGFTWIYGLAFLFALGIMYSIFLYVFEGHLVPTVEAAVNNTITDAAARAEVFSGISKYMTYFKMMPFILFFIVVIYMFATAIYRQGGNQY
jgi:cellulose synthase/poly-beta-1,6-N-acetylglucosamine synthase-like glycosyltransferase